jgi:hypothetical protein
MLIDPKTGLPVVADPKKVALECLPYFRAMDATPIPQQEVLAQLEQLPMGVMQTLGQYEREKAHGKHPGETMVADPSLYPVKLPFGFFARLITELARSRGIALPWEDAEAERLAAEAAQREAAGLSPAARPSVEVAGPEAAEDVPGPEAVLDLLAAARARATGSPRGKSL